MYLLSLKNYSEKWFNEYEKTILEALKFDEYEMYQQPIGNIYLCSIFDEIEEIEFLKKKEKIPPLVFEGVLEQKVPCLLIVLNDKHKDNLPLTNEQLTRKFEMIKNFNTNMTVVITDINSNLSSDIINENDIWKDYIHKLDLYSTNYNINLNKGQMITTEERENLRNHIWRFFNDSVRLFWQLLINEYDEEVNNNKKGIKNGFLSIFKKTEKIEYVNVFNVYKVNFDFL